MRAFSFCDSTEITKGIGSMAMVSPSAEAIFAATSLASESITMVTSLSGM